MFVSPGHKIDLATSVQIVLETCRDVRLPEPLRRADKVSRQLLAQGIALRESLFCIHLPVAFLSLCAMRYALCLNGVTHTFRDTSSIVPFPLRCSQGNWHRKIEGIPLHSFQNRFPELRQPLLLSGCQRPIGRNLGKTSSHSPTRRRLLSVQL